MYQPDPYNHVLFNFIKLVNETEEQAFQNEKLAKGLTFTEIHVIYQLGKYGSPQPMNIIAQDLEITQSSLTALVNKIEDKGFLKRVREHEDRRIVELKLTAKGETLNQFHTQYHKNLLKKIRSTLDQKETELFFQYIEKLNRAIKVPITLDTLKPGQSAKIESIQGEGSIKKRLMEMGVLPGTVLKLLKIAPLGDPLEIQVRDYLISIRKHEASQIEVGLFEGSTI
ncbi:MAG: FeoA domain-containing protein [Deltaproteobacteria bacterium]|nr:FeoA domain-containing protein [Deltaproteobacteria bacterium]